MHFHLALLQACGQRCCRLPSVALLVSPSCPLIIPLKKNTTFTVCRGWRYCPTHPPSILILPLHPSILIIPSQPNTPASPFDCNTSLTHIITGMWNSQLRHKIFHQLLIYWCRIHQWFRWMGVCKQSRWRHSVTEPHTRWRICVTMATLWQQQDGGYMLFYIFNSTVVDWTCFFYFHILTTIHGQNHIKKAYSLTKTHAKFWIRKYRK